MSKQERLSVWMYGRHIATLMRVRDRLSLSYTEEAQETYDVNMPLLSLSLPLGPQAFPHGKARPFFDGLLPEGETRRMLAYDFRLQEEDTFGLLRLLGRDCAGALVILPEGEPLPGLDTSPRIPMSEEEVSARLRQLSVEPLGVDEQVRGSLAGVQQKMVLGNGDAHAKNFSILHLESGAVHLAPAYDIMSTALYPRADVRPGMYVNPKTSIHHIKTRDVIAEAHAWGLNQGHATARIAGLVTRLPAAIAAAAVDVPTAPQELIELINTRAAAFAADLTSPAAT